MKMKRALIALAMIGLTGAGLAEALDPMPVATDELLTDTTLEDGDTVKQAQQILIDLGLLEDDADGLPGPRTAEALRGFQEAHGLAVTGMLDPATLVALEAALPVTNAEAQQRLIDLGYLSGTADGLWGSRSAAAMKLFQALHDLEVTGRADAETARRLFSDDVVKVPAGIYTGDKGDYKISASIGCALFPNHGDTFQTLYKSADQALYKSKKGGKDTYSIYNSEEASQDA